MEVAPRLIDVRVPESARGVVLVLHGGASRGERMVSPAQLSVLRMIPIARRIARAGRGELAVIRLLNSRRGWDAKHTPVHDVEWALAEIRERVGSLPACLVGHSLGGRAAILASIHPMVHSAVALAPWVYPTDLPPGDLAGRRILIVHGTADRIASPARSAELARRLASRAEVSYVEVAGGRHAMLRHHNAFSGAAAEFAKSSLLS